MKRLPVQADCSMNCLMKRRSWSVNCDSWNLRLSSREAKLWLWQHVTESLLTSTVHSRYEEEPHGLFRCSWRGYGDRIFYINGPCITKAWSVYVPDQASSTWLRCTSHSIRASSHWLYSSRKGTGQGAFVWCTNESLHVFPEKCRRCSGSDWSRRWTCQTFLRSFSVCRAQGVKQIISSDEIHSKMDSQVGKSVIHDWYLLRHLIPWQRSETVLFVRKIWVLKRKKYH